MLCHSIHSGWPCSKRTDCWQISSSIVLYLQGDCAKWALRGVEQHTASAAQAVQTLPRLRSALPPSAVAQPENTCRLELHRRPGKLSRNAQHVTELWVGGWVGGGGGGREADMCRETGNERQRWGERERGTQVHKEYLALILLYFVVFNLLLELKRWRYFFFLLHLLNHFFAYNSLECNFIDWFALY